MGISAGHAYPEIQPLYGGHSEPWVWGYDVSPRARCPPPDRSESMSGVRGMGVGEGE